jgi:hypothetical protein
MNTVGIFDFGGVVASSDTPNFVRGRQTLRRSAKTLDRAAWPRDLALNRSLRGQKGL